MSCSFLLIALCTAYLTTVTVFYDTITILWRAQITCYLILSMHVRLLKVYHEVDFRELNFNYFKSHFVITYC